MTRILVLDDSATMRRIVRNHLQTMGFESVEEVDNGHAALAKQPQRELVRALVGRDARPDEHRPQRAGYVPPDARQTVAERIAAALDPKTLAEKVSQILSDATVKA